MLAFRKIIALFLCFASVFLIAGSCCVPASAVVINSGNFKAVAEFADIVFANSSIDKPLNTSEFIDWYLSHDLSDACPDSPGGIHGWKYNVAAGALTGGFCVSCMFCGMTAREYMDVLEEEKLSTLPPGLQSTSGGTTAKGVGYEFGSYDSEFWSAVNLYKVAQRASVGQFMLLGNYGRVSIALYGIAVGKQTCGARYFCYSRPDDNNVLPYTAIDLPLGGFVSINSTLDLGSAVCYLSVADFQLAASAGELPESCAYLTSNSCIGYIVNTSGSPAGMNVYFSVTDCYVSTDFGASVVYADYVKPLGDWFHSTTTHTPKVAIPAVYDCSSDYGSDTRPAAVMQTINNYNIDNSVTDNSTNINYYIGTVDASNNVTNVYNMNVYDEETLIFTEPVTGAQYQTTGWTYNYTNRSYNIDLEPGTLTYDGTDIDNIIIIYSDDEFAIFFHNGDTLVGVDTYAYVAVSGSECSLYGHTYTYETTKGASCTSTGEQKGICSVCSGEVVETLPALEHVYTYSVLKEATCSAVGTAIYTCGTCGAQYSDTIPMSEHISEIMQTVPTEYDEDGGVISYGYTIYKCTTCGEEYTISDAPEVENEGWFSWLGNQFKKLASSLFNGLAEGIEYLTGTVIKSVTDLGLGLIEWLFGLLDVDILDTWYTWFDDDNEYFNTEFGTEVESVWDKQ